MSGRITRIVKRTAPSPFFSFGRKPKILPMTRSDEREQAELHRRRQARLERLRQHEEDWP